MPLLNAPLGLQLYTLRNELKADAHATLAAVKAAGYDHVEPMDTEQLLEVKPLCDDLDLGIHSCHYNWTAVTGNQAMLEKLSPGSAPKQNLDEMIEAALKCGVTDLVFGYMLPAERANLTDFGRRVQEINAAHARIASAGITPCYHNHSFEFKDLSIFGGMGWETLQYQIDWSVTKLQVDVFWIRMSGFIPTVFMSQHRDKLRSVHLKDAPRGCGLHFDEHAVPHELFLPVGQGDIPFDEVIALAEEAGCAYYIVEQDFSADPLASIMQSARALRE